VSKRTTILLAIGVIAALVVGWQAAAFAVHDTGAFELDGNATNAAATPGDDWDNVCHQVTKTLPTPLCTSATDTNGATAVDWVSEPNTSASIFTGGGSKDPNDINQWAWKDAGGLPDKDNLLHSFAARYPSTPQGDVLFFGSDRFDNSGDAQQGFWFFQKPVTLGSNSVGGGKGFTGVHQKGDLLIISDFSNGGTTSTINVYSWDPSVSGNLKQLATSNSAKCGTANPDNFCGIVNPTNGTPAPWPYTDKSGNHTYLNGEFYEGGVNLTALGLNDRCFSSVASETRSSTSTTATLKDFTLGSFGNCGSKVTTQSSDTGSKPVEFDGSNSVSDSATVGVTGTTTWNGTVQFSLKGPIGSPLETTKDIGTPQNVSNSTSTVQSPTASVTAAGDYCWSAKFTSATDGVPDGVDDGTNECFTITPVTPQLATTAGDDVNLGDPITDTANLTGTANKPGTPAINPTTAGGKASGSITFTAYGPDNCTTKAYTSAAVPVSGDGTYSPVSFTPTQPGTYHWVADYTGDAPNTNAASHNSDCTDANEDVVVTSVPSSMTTAQSFIPNDSTTISASQGGNLAGSVHFQAFESSDCSGTAIVDQTKTVSGTSSQTVSTTNTTVSTTAANISWKVSYDSTNAAQQDISAKCFEKTALAIDNGGTVTSP
jgi:hypothetical protein